MTICSVWAKDTPKTNDIPQFVLLPCFTLAFSRFNLTKMREYSYFVYILMAIAREKELKKWNSSKKEALIARKNPEWRFLNDDV